MSTKGGLVVISGPSGVGKSTVAAELLKLPGITRSVSATTRAPRGKERDGVDYFFMTPARFEEGVAKQEFLEHAVVAGNRYGTPKRAVDGAVAAGQVVVLAIDVQGAAALRAMGQPFLGIFLAPPSMEELRRRMSSASSFSRRSMSTTVRLTSSSSTASCRWSSSTAPERP